MTIMIPPKASSFTFNDAVFNGINCTCHLAYKHLGHMKWGLIFVFFQIYILQSTDIKSRGFFDRCKLRL